jgi:hypothetical protein
MRDRYRPPRAPLSDNALFKPRAHVWDVMIVMSLLAMWLLDYPHGAISRFIGQHFPWPAERSLRWPALLLERTLIEAGVCIPAALVLALRLRRTGVAIALLLSAVFCGRIAFESPQALPGSAQWRFLLVIAGIHTALLVAATAYFAYLAHRTHADGA